MSYSRRPIHRNHHILVDKFLFAALSFRHGLVYDNNSWTLVDFELKSCVTANIGIRSSYFLYLKKDTSKYRTAVIVCEANSLVK